MTSKRLEIARGKHVLERVLYGKDFDAILHDAVVYPPAAVLAENLPVLWAFHTREGLYANPGICWKHLCRVGYIAREGNGVFGVEVDGDVASCAAEACGGSFGPVRGGVHQATSRFFGGRLLAVLWPLESFFRSAWIIRLTSSYPLDLVVGVHFAALRLALGDEDIFVHLGVVHLLADLLPVGGGEEHGGGAAVLREDDGAVGLGGARHAVRKRVAELAERDDVFGWLEVEHDDFSFGVGARYCTRFRT